ncbi:PQQ-binding-like beta-propeller repeat protein [Candidatus Pelagibacter sp.]|uniref:PQQ-binding-like beta-propeller repeat protein n=1 Tax=Candidatus Pelagibacter sp. TaxID=2024849 RepID=UPI003F82B8CA
MNKVFVILIFSIFLSNCSLNENSRIWNKKEKIENENKVSKKILAEKEIISTEFNPLLKLDLSKNKQNNKIFDPLNNFGSSKYYGQINKINNYKFSKLENFNQFNFEPLILDDGVIVFEKKGTIIRFNNNQKVVWKNNFYSKTEKKIHPSLSFAITDKNLIVADSIAKISSINLLTGNLIWSKKSEYPFNSEIKISKDKFFVVDFKNTLRCFYIKDGSECWNIKTEESFTVSNSKFSMLIKDNLLIYNNSLGDITAVDISSGLIQWQLPTQKSSIVNETYGFNFSKLVSDGNSIFFSNNKNQFYSVDLSSGTTNWMSEINSILTPIIIGNFIFTISENGYLFTIQKNEGNIIRINDIYKNFNLKKRKKIKPTGFTIGGNNLYLTNSDGNLIVINLSTGNVLKIEKVGRDLISKPLIYNENLFIVKNGSITQYD